MSHLFSNSQFITARLPLMAAVLFGILVAVSVLAAVTPAQSQGIEPQCIDQLARQCGEIQPGSGRIQKCFDDNRDKFSPVCQQQLMEGKAEAAAGIVQSRQRTDLAKEQQQLVDKAKMTLDAFASDPEAGPAIRDYKVEAKGLFIVPQFLRGAFVFGGAGGSGVLIVRDEETKKWSEPVFYTIGSASFGLQIGGDVSEMVFVVRNQKGLEEFYSSDFKLGVDASIVVGSLGSGASAKGITADLVAYAKKKGVFGGIAVDGSIIKVSDESNADYYGKAVRPTDIIVTQTVSNPKSADLRNAAAKLMQ